MQGAGQDTVFVNKHTFGAPARNVLRANDEIYARVGTTLLLRTREGWEDTGEHFTKAFTFYNNQFFEADYIPESFSFNPWLMRRLIPQDALTNPSIAQVGNELFICVGGSVLEYKINPFYTHSYQSMSVRDIYMGDSLKVVSTYSGVFINDTLRVSEPEYSSGEFVRIRGRYFLCSDDLYSFQPPATFSRIRLEPHARLGHVRKIIEAQGRLYSLHTLSINRIDSAKGMEPIHQEYEYNDLEPVGRSLLFCTNTGEVFRMTNDRDSLLFDLDSRIRDIYMWRDRTYFSTDIGVYMIRGGRAETLECVIDLPSAVGVVTDIQNNLWISTENGLFILPDDRTEPIPFIPDVEFNRGALRYNDDKVYAGSISGLYVIDIYKVVRDFLPLHVYARPGRRIGMVAAGALFLALSVGGVVAYYYGRRRKAVIPSPEQHRKISIEQIEADIRKNNIMTVAGMAEFYKTNTVQLNRMFKAFDTTPGRHLQKVKLELAKELLSAASPMSEVTTRTGYSARYIRKKLRK
jgi:AraC-like DNA-binding protein